MCHIRSEMLAPQTYMDARMIVDCYAQQKCLDIREKKNTISTVCQFNLSIVRVFMQLIWSAIGEHANWKFVETMRL